MLRLVHRLIGVCIYLKEFLHQILNDTTENQEISKNEDKTVDGESLEKASEKLDITEQIEDAHNVTNNKKKSSEMNKNITREEEICNFLLCGN
jgi:hypothetical protein